MNEQIKINDITVDLTATGMDNVPELPCSDRVQEEKLSLQLWSEFLAGRLEMTVRRASAGENAKFPCSLVGKDGRKFCSFTMTKDFFALILLHQDPYELPARGCPMRLFPELHNRSLFCLLQDSTEYSGIASMSYHFAEEPYGYSAFKLSGYRFSLEKFPASRAKQYSTDVSEELALQREVNHWFDIGFPNGLFEPVPAFPGDMTSNWMVMCFDFTNEIGEVMQKVLKVYRIHNAHHFVKCYFPLTRWYCKDIHAAFTVGVGLPEKQILFNLPLVLKADIVVVCTSLESALANQQINGDDETVAFTAFVCDGARFDQVDFTPLKEKVVRVFIANHSGFSLAESYMADYPLYEYLRNVVKIKDLGIIQMEVKYPDVSDVYDIDQLMAAHRCQKPHIVDGSVFEVPDAEISQMCEKAQAEIDRKREQSKDMPFWNATTETAATSAAPASTRLTDQIISRPYIVGGTVTVIESAPGMGKSCMATAWAANIAGSADPFLEDRCLTRCTPRNGRGYKVAYLVFDSDGVPTIQEHRKDFAGNLGKNDTNFIQRDMAGEEINYSLPANYNAFIAVLNDIRDNEGQRGQNIDVLFIDTLLGFTHEKPNNSFEVLTKLSKEFPNMAIVVLHHLNLENKTFGGTRTTMGPRVILKLFRTDEQQKMLNGREPTLHDPFTVEIAKFNANKISEDGAPFEVKLDDKNHFVVINSPTPRDELRRLLVKAYEQKYHLAQAEIGRLFGATDRTIRNWLSEGKKS